ncbi:MAG: hypothetical protein AAGK32_07485 [Actinomycetota bacterium]
MATLTEAAVTLGVARASWELDTRATMTRAALVAVGAWAVLAWSRFGIQGLLAPRALVRFVLIGFYGWLALAVMIWVIGRLADRSLPSTSGPIGRLTGSGVALIDIVRVTGRAHRPLLVLGVVVQVTALLLRLNGPGLVVAAVGLGLWMPAMLLGGVGHAFELRPARAALVVAGPYAGWLLLLAPFLNGQVGHLL